MAGGISISKNVLPTMQINNAFYPGRSLGVLLHGPHGIGKTLMGQALCNEMGAHVVHVNVSRQMFGLIEFTLQWNLNNSNL